MQLSIDVTKSVSMSSLTSDGFKRSAFLVENVFFQPQKSRAAVTLKIHFNECTFSYFVLSFIKIITVKRYQKENFILL